MNTETGQVYEGQEAIKAAEERGEPLTRITNAQAQRIRQAHERAANRRFAERYMAREARR